MASPRLPRQLASRLARPPKEAAGHRASVLCPFIVAIDTREQRPYPFREFETNVNEGSRLIIVNTARVTLSTGQGDYSIVGMPSVGIERKSKADLYGSISQGRENFEKRLGLMSTGLALGGAHVVVEASAREIIAEPPPHTQMNPRALWRTINAWIIRYPAVHWHFMWDREAAEGQTFRLLERFWAVHHQPVSTPTKDGP